MFTLQSVPPTEQKKGLAQTAGFSLHAGIGIEAHARGKLERLCCYVSRPAVAEERLALTERATFGYNSRARTVLRHDALPSYVVDKSREP